jgi:hypothetical protein
MQGFTGSGSTEVGRAMPQIRGPARDLAHAFEQIAR